MSADTAGATSTIDATLAAFADEVGADGPIAVAGNQTRWHAGGPADDGVRLVHAPTGIVEYVPDEMTVTVRAGTSVEELHAELAGKGQRTGLPERGGSVGGAVAVGENSEFVLGRGRVREAVLQVRYVSDDGHLIKGGGPTVKNVTGFDLPRLMVGSLGTLGLFAEFILRTNPIPECQRWLRSDDVDPFAVATATLRQAAIFWDGSATWVQIEGHAPAVDAEQQRLRAIGTFEQIEAGPIIDGHRWSVTPKALRTPSNEWGEQWLASVGVGTIWASNAQPPATPSAGVQQLAQRVKAQFDPRGRLNPGRTPGER